jgi:hypothetical protein
MTDLVIPNFGQLLAPYIGAVPAEAMPRFLALLERGAAARYRQWMTMLPEHADVLGVCAAAEDEIADRIEAVFALDESLRPVVEAPLADATRTYYDVFDAVTVWDQLRIQANAERQGAQAWRNIASRTADERVIAALAACSELEEASADRLDALIAAHAPEA